MPKRNRSKKMRGGLFGFFEGKEEKPAYGSSSEKGWMDSATSMFSSEPAKKPYSAPPADKPYSPPPPTTPPPTYQSPGYGGKRRKHKSRRMRGGYSDNVSMTNLASHAAPFSGATARPQAYVGGRRTKRRCHKHKRTHRRHCRK
jgi:hypothetical protein